MHYHGICVTSLLSDGPKEKQLINTGGQSLLELQFKSNISHCCKASPLLGLSKYLSNTFLTQ